jgi:aquaporin NIP
MDDSVALWRRAAVEAMSTFMLVFAGCGAIVSNAHTHGALGAVGVSLVFAFVITAALYAGGHISGAHYNPAVTVAFVAARHFPAREAAAYIGAQIGAATAAALLLAAWPDQPAALGATVPSAGVGTALVYEVVMSAFLMFVITAVATDTRAAGAAAAIAIGLTVGLEALFGGPRPERR